MELISYKYYVRCCNMLVLFKTNYSDEKVIAEARKKIKDNNAVYSALVLGTIMY